MSVIVIPNAVLWVRMPSVSREVTAALKMDMDLLKETSAKLG